MINEETKKFLTDTLGIDVDVLKEALTSENEVEVKHKSGDFLDEEKLNELKQNLIKKGYEDGRVAHVEKAAKALKDKYKIDVEGRDLEKVLEAYGKQILQNEKIPVDKKNKELQESLEKVRLQSQKDVEALTQKIEELKNDKKQFKLNSELIKQIPQEINGVTPEQALILAKTKYKFDYNDEGEIIGMKGEKVIKDKYEKPVPVKDILLDFAKENKWIEAEGRGGENELGDPKKFTSMNDVFKYMKENNIDPYSSEGNKLQDDFNNLNK